MKRAKLFLFLLLFLATIQYVPSDSLAAIPVVEDGDFLSFGYTLEANATIIETYTETNTRKIRILEQTFTPPGLFDELVGMPLGSNKGVVVVPPEEGFLPTDLNPTYAYLTGFALYYTNLKIYEINGEHYTDLPTVGTEPGTFGYYALRIGLGLIGVAAFVGLVYGGYRLYPRVFGKRCAVCKALAIGTCTKCGRKFCERCYSNGCPYCKARTLKRLKSSS
ncbi:MAG: hypothetical protein KGD64_00550 [Candidatus Heimdallarchaeota archaeon]|nr:hypothetical protein [Candidatus Heimdallarchaeota archaeon]